MFHIIEFLRDGKRKSQASSFPISGRFIVALLASSFVLAATLYSYTNYGSSTIAGVMAGSFQVDSRGAASYSLPLTVAPGTKGLQPNLSITYNSHSKMSGYLGVGWQLQGIDQITRCGKTKGIEGINRNVNFTNQDRLCFNGERLVSSNGANPSDSSYWSASYYHTKNENWVRVQRSSSTCGSHGPCAFSAKTKDGRNLYFGYNSHNHRYPRIGGTPGTWHLDRVTDAHGNRMDITYHATSNQAWNTARPIEINYGGNRGSAHNRKVKFVWSLVDEANKQFSYGANLSNNSNGLYVYQHILSRVEMSVSDSIFKVYHMTYQTSPTSNRKLLKEIQECDSIANGKCYEPLQLTWNAPSFNKGFYRSTLNDTGYPGKYVNIIPGDFNGDGLSDYIRQEKGSWASSDNDNTFRVYLSNGDRTFTKVDGNSTDNAELKGSHEVNGKIRGALIIPGDFNGDGKTDFIRQEFGEWARPDTIKTFAVYLSNGNGTFSRTIPNGDDYQYWLKGTHNSCDTNSEF